MKIKEVTEEKIIFDNGTEITYYHEQDCCEEVYADFDHLKNGSRLEPLTQDHEFSEDIQIEGVPGVGFRFGGPTGWEFIPCYNTQNGYYSSDLEIIITYPDKTVKKINVYIEEDSF